ncbi:hypothetical protein ACHAWF_014861 [Thalassiosira exigua]
MKISSLAIAAVGCLALAPSAFGVSQTLVDQYPFRRGSDKFVGNSMWLFGRDGVHVYTPDGSEHLSHVPNEQMCESEADFKGPSHMYCRFRDVVSDGKKYVWTNSPRSEDGIAVFDIDTGSLVGAFETCVGPNDLEYHAVRDEVWVRCSGGADANSTGDDPSHLDVISASSPTGEAQTDILLKDRALQEGLSSKGYTVVHHSLGDVGYLTDDSDPRLFKIDLAKKEIVDAVELIPAKAHGLYEAAYSPLNGHVYARALMCCTCGGPDADVPSCGRNDAPGYPVSPTTGKGAGLEGVAGLCGRSCSGVPGVDTVGVYEYDAKAGRVVATHVLAEGIGGDPYPSPDGKYIVLMGKNGGSTVRVIEAGLPGAPSTTLVDLDLEFSMEGYETLSVRKDFAFVERDDKTLLVMPSGTEHKVAIVDFSDDFAVTHVRFSDAPFENGAPHGRYRSVEWAVGTDYVWTNDSTEDEHYVIDVVNAELVETITGIARSELISVQNWERMREGARRDEMMAEVRSANAATEGAAQGSSDADAVGAAALIVGCLALAVGAWNMYVLSNKNKNGARSIETARLVTGVPSAVDTASQGVQGADGGGGGAVASRSTRGPGATVPGPRGQSWDISDYGRIEVLVVGMQEAIPESSIFGGFVATTSLTKKLTGHVECDRHLFRDALGDGIVQVFKPRITRVLAPRMRMCATASFWETSPLVRTDKSVCDCILSGYSTSRHGMQDWFIGDLRSNIPPLCTIDSINLQHLKVGNRVRNKMKSFMKVVERLARDKDVWLEKVSDWDYKSVTYMWDTIKEEFTNKYARTKRKKELTWSTVYNNMSNANAFGNPRNKGAKIS